MKEEEGKIVEASNEQASEEKEEKTIMTRLITKA